MMTPVPSSSNASLSASHSHRHDASSPERAIPDIPSRPETKPLLTGWLAAARKQSQSSQTNIDHPVHAPKTGERSAVLRFAPAAASIQTRPARSIPRPMGRLKVTKARVSTGSLPPEEYSSSVQGREIVARQTAICEAYKRGKYKLPNMLRMTTSNIKKCGPNEALQCTEILKASGVIPDAIIYNALLSVFGNSGRVDQALEVFADMNKAGIEPNVVTYNTLISAYEKGGQAGKALEVFVDMKKAGVKPDIITYNALISAYGNCGLADQAIKVFSDINKAVIKPNLITYNALISACGNGGLASKALKVFTDMNKSGVKPNDVTYNALISACEKGGLANRALEVFSDMNKAGVEPDVTTYNTLISACEKSRMAGRALKVFADMDKAGVKPNVITYNALISACEKGGQADRAQLLLQHAVAQRIFHNTLGYDAERNAVNFHVNSIYAEYTSYEHEPGVPTAVAKAVFQYHWQRNNIEPGTAFIVGSHGQDLIKNAIQECLKERGMHVKVATLPNGSANEGCLVAMPGEGTKGASVEPGVISNSVPISNNENYEVADSGRTAQSVAPAISTDKAAIATSRKRRRAKKPALKSPAEGHPVAKAPEPISTSASQFQVLMNGLKTLWQGWSTRIWGA